jgi:hypothetical protein
MKTIRISETVRFGVGRSARRLILNGPEPELPETANGRIPRVTRWMALAIRLETLMQQGALTNQAQAARLGNVTRARLSQIMSLLHLAPDIQEAVLFLPRLACGRDPCQLRHLLPVTRLLDWEKQRAAWCLIWQERLAPPARMGKTR